jgi:quercetin dioxygenase-like cupin family protein
METLERRNHDFDSLLHYFDLRQTAQLLKDERPIHSGSKNAVTLAKSPTINVVLILLQGGRVLPEYHTERATSILIFSGVVEFSTAEETTRLKSGMFVAVREGLTHTIRALEESILLVTVAPKMKDGVPASS